MLRPLYAPKISLDTRWMRGWVDSTVDLDDVAKRKIVIWNGTLVVLPISKWK
jgi:hypothetical protein